MKKIRFLIKTLLVVVGMVGGTMSAAAEDEYTDVYYRCSTFGDDSIWTEKDLTDWSGASTLGIDVPTSADDANHYGFGLEGREAFTAKKEFVIQDGAKVKYEVVWRMGSSTANASNYSFIQFGDKVRISWNSAYYFYLNLDGQSSATTQIGNKGGNTKYNKKITIIFNTVTKKVESFIFDGSDITSKVTDALDGNFNSVSFGLVKPKGLGWDVPTYLTSIKVSEQKQTVSYKDYTINYKLEDDIVYTKTESAAVGDEIKASTIVYDEDGGKYFIVSDEAPTITISDTDENVLDVNVRKAYTATLSVKTTKNGVSTTDTKTLIEADDNSCNWSYFYSLYAEKDGKYYVCDNNTDAFGESGTFTDGETIDKEVTYSILADDVVFFFEAENGASVIDTKMGYSKYSNGGYAAAKAENVSNRGQSVGTLGAGKYQFTASIVGNEGRKLVLRDKSSTDREANIIAEITKNGLQTVEFTLDSEKEIVVNGKNSDDANAKSNQSADFDYAFIKKLATYVPVTISSDYGYSTFSSDVDVDFSANDGITVYTAKMNEDNTVVKLTEVADKKVPAGEGVLLKGEGTFTGVATTGVAAFTDNAFVASEGGTTVTRADGIYVLNNKSGIGFYPFVGTLSKGKAHLVIANSEAKSIKMSFGDETTGISEIETTGEASGVYHTLSGIRVQNPAKGLYILNGKKVIIK